MTTTRIETVDFLYLRMPVVQDIGDGSQDAVLVRIRAGGFTGWGQCEASPLTSIAAFVTPMSHSACKNVGHDLRGQRMECPEDIARLGARMRANSLDLLQADHAWSGIDIALWDLLGRMRGEPVYRLLEDGAARGGVAGKLPYASVLFGDSPQETLVKARAIAADAYRAAKFGWGPYGRGSVQADRDQVQAAREGLGREAKLLIDAGTVWDEDVEAAAARMPALREAGVTWLEEPFHTHALDAYAALAKRSDGVALAAGEGSHNQHLAKHLIDHGGIGFVQIDTGRIGGITPASLVAEYAYGKRVTYVNHTFTSHLSLSASLQPYVGDDKAMLCEYPAEASRLASCLTYQRIVRDANGLIRAPEAPGLGMTPDPKILALYLVPVRIEVDGESIYRSPEPGDGVAVTVPDSAQFKRSAGA